MNPEPITLTSYCLRKKPVVHNSGVENDDTI